MTPELQMKVERAIRLLQSVAPTDGSPVEVAYSGGKDSDVILELTRMAGINYRAIYKNTTIDPPGTIAHAKENGAEIIRPKKTFFELVEYAGFPNRFMRTCCYYLKESHVGLSKKIMGIRRSESVKRSSRYKEPTECRTVAGNKKIHFEAIYPILDWTDGDVVAFIEERGIKLHSLYYREDGTIDPKRRLGCMCCPLATRKKRISQFQQWPNMVKAYIRAGQKYIDTHPDGKLASRYANAYDWFVCDVFFDHRYQWEQSRQGMFEPQDSKKFLEDYFKIKF
jgi:phosphoadenosine phosphosulfate reductase